MSKAIERAIEVFPHKEGESEFMYSATEKLQQLFVIGYEQAEKDIIQRIRDELERRLDLYGCLSKETIHPVRLDEERSMLRFLDELEKE